MTRLYQAEQERQEYIPRYSPPKDAEPSSADPKRRRKSSKTPDPSPPSTAAAATASSSKVTHEDIAKAFGLQPAKTTPAAVPVPESPVDLCSSPEVDDNPVVHEYFDAGADALVRVYKDTL